MTQWSCHWRKPHRCNVEATHKVIYKGGVTFLCGRHMLEDVESHPEYIDKIFRLSDAEDVTTELLGEAEG